MADTARNALSTPDPSRERSLTAILDWIDPTRLPPEVQESLTLIGPYLASGLTYRQIGERLSPARSEDWVSTRVAAVKQELIAQALERVDEMDARLRERVLELRGTTA